ncbi:MAG: FAD-dependent oxidoreductase [Deltaproteobacteria bacterium]|nr:FAD-dependent oxidoreductase [Deltaproteobacteria bacterium]
MKKYALYVDNAACWGCKACEVACKQETDMPEGVKLISVQEDGPRLVDGEPYFMFRVNVCRHCDEPPCGAACPEGAITKDPATGIVVHDPEKCTGCETAKSNGLEYKQGVSPCKKNCPAGNNVQAFLSLAARGKFDEALKIIRETSPFPAICGRVCYHPCESGCNRGQVDEPVAVKAVERYLGDFALNEGRLPFPRIKARKDEKVAVIGSGPAGLSCAYYLAREGYPVTILEKDDCLGGMLTMGIPSYRLPRHIVEQEIQMVRDMGVTMMTGVEVGKDTTIERLREEGFKAFFIAIGTQECRRMGIEGEDLKGVHGGLEFLRKVNMGESVSLGKTVAVIGGGNTALDAARMARRLGAENTFILYRRGLEEMPAHPEEVEETLEEGIAIQPLTQPIRITGKKNGRVHALECLKTSLGEPDETGRRRPEPVPGSEFTLEVDTVIMALGQEADWSCLTPECSCTVSPWGTLNVDPLTLQSDDPDIFAGGDAVRGPRTVTEAIADGREAAISIDRYLQGRDLWWDRKRDWAVIPLPRDKTFDLRPRISGSSLDPRKRADNFDEVQKGFTEEMVLQEAQRCITCGSSCVQACPYGAMVFDGVNGTARKCNLCIHRVEKGLFPACADNVCLAHCIYFGDPDEIRRQVEQKHRAWSKAPVEKIMATGR